MKAKIAARSAILSLAVVAAVLLLVSGGGLALAARSTPVNPSAAGIGSQMTPTPAVQPGAGSRDGVIPPSTGDPATGPMPGAGGDAQTGRVTATITLEGPSGAEIFARLSPGGAAHTSPRAALAAAWQAVLNALSQQKLIAALTGPDIGATVIGQSRLAANSVTVQVDAAMIPAIRRLPGVRSVTVNVPENTDPVFPPRDQLDLGQPPPGDQLD
ncbi:MAG: hypothetical protein IT323_05055 [Anaerolineae bacterium]|nr:hypothetical protein [Anaerolineae bacterium]